MKLFINSYIEKLLKKANYEYDKQTKNWCASLDILPGAYAQAETVEGTREQLAEVIEDYILISLHEHHSLPNFKKLDFQKQFSYAQANSS